MLEELDYDGAARLHEVREARLKAEEAEGGRTSVTGHSCDADARSCMVVVGKQGNFAGAAALRRQLEG